VKGTGQAAAWEYDWGGLYMSRLIKSLAILSATMSLAGPAHATDIKDHFKMVVDDKGRFDQMLLDVAEKLLRDQGRPDLALRLHKLFTEITPGNKISQGMAEYTLNLSDMLRAEIKREASNPSLPHLQAETAFRDVAQDHGINLPPTFETMAASFHRQYPLRDLVKENVR